MANKTKNEIKITSKSIVMDIVLATAPNIIFSILFPFCGSNLGLINNNKLTPIGVGVCIMYFIIISLVIIFCNFISHKDDFIISESEFDNIIKAKETFKANFKIADNIIDYVDKICDSKLITLKKEIKSHFDNSLIPYPMIISNPQKQLNEILNKMFDCISKIIGKSKSSLYFDVAININNQGWEWLEGFAPEDGVIIDDIASENSLFCNLITKDKNYSGFLFYNKKSAAISKGRYKQLSVDEDENGQLIDGSVLAKHIFIGESYKTRWAELALFISSNNNEFFISEEDIKREGDLISNARKTLKNHVFKHFDRRLQIELSLLLLETLNNTHDDVKDMQDNQQDDSIIITQ